MTNGLFYLGLTCLISAILGKGLSAFGVNIPEVGSTRRQLVLAVVGAALTCVSIAAQKYGFLDPPSVAGGSEAYALVSPIHQQAKLKNESDPQKVDTVGNCSPIIVGVTSNASMSFNCYR